MSCGELGKCFGGGGGSNFFFRGRNVHKESFKARLKFSSETEHLKRDWFFKLRARMDSGRFLRKTADWGLSLLGQSLKRGLKHMVFGVTSCC